MKLYDWRVDFIKFFAIFSVVVLHSISKPILIEYRFQFYFWQAMPIFLFLIGYNFSYSYLKISSYFYFVFKRLARILIALITFNLIYYIFFYPRNELNLIYRLFLIPYPNYGTYFIGMLLILILIFPFLFKGVIFLKEKIEDLNLLIFLFFLISGVLDILFTNLLSSKFLYSMLPVRYLFDIFLGILFFLYREELLKLWFIYVGLILNVVWLLYYPDMIKEFFPIKWLNWWGFQHIFYFYTLFLVFFLYKLVPSMGIFNNKIVSLIGRASFHIFLFQSIFFTFLRKYFYNYEFKVLIYVLSCIGIGVLWFLMEQKMSTLFKFFRKRLFNDFSNNSL